MPIHMHRFLLVGATTLLAVSASRLGSGTENTENTGWILLAVASAALLYVSEIWSDLDGHAKHLARSSRSDIRAARRDVYKSERPMHSNYVLTGSVIILVVGLQRVL